MGVGNREICNITQSKCLKSIESDIGTNETQQEEVATYTGHIPKYTTVFDSPALETYEDTRFVRIFQTFDCRVGIRHAALSREMTYAQRQMMSSSNRIENASQRSRERQSSSSSSTGTRDSHQPHVT